MSETLTIGEENFAITSRELIAEKCLASEAHQMFEVVTQSDGTFVVCVECESSRRIEPPKP